MDSILDHLVHVEILPLSKAETLTPQVKRGVLHIPIREGSTFHSTDYKLETSLKRAGRRTVEDKVRVFDREKFFKKVGEDKFDETRKYIAKKKVKSVHIYTSSDTNQFSSAYALASKITKNAKMLKWRDRTFETEWDLFLFLRYKPWSIREDILSEVKEENGELFLNYNSILARHMRQ